MGGESFHTFSWFLSCFCRVFVVPRRLRTNGTGKLSCDDGLILEAVRVALFRWPRSNGTAVARR